MTQHDYNLETPVKQILTGPFTRQRLFGKSPETARGYRNAYAKLLGYLERPPLLSDLNDDTLAGMLTALSEKRSNRYANNIRSYIVAFWRWCNLRGYTPTGPTLEKLPEPESLPTAFTVEQLKALFAQARHESSSRQRATRNINGVPGGLYWEAKYRAIFSTGERIGAVMRWERSMIDLETGLLQEPARIRKGRKFAHTVAITGRALELVKEVLDCHGEARIFPWNKHPLSIYHTMRRHLERAGLPTDPYRWSFHCIRRSHASYVVLAEGEAGAQDSLGHISRHNTRRYVAPSIVKPKTYAHVLPEVD